MMSTSVCKEEHLSHRSFTHSKNESLPIVFILRTQSVHPMRDHDPEYQPHVTSGSRVTGCANFIN